MSISSLIMPKRPDSAVMKQLQSSALTFVQAKQPEAVSNRPATYIHIKPRVEDEENSDSDNQTDDTKTKNGKKSIDNSKNSTISALSQKRSASEKESESDDSNDSEYEDALVLEKPDIKNKKQKKNQSENPASTNQNKDHKHMKPAKSSNLFEISRVSSDLNSNESQNEDDSENDEDYNDDDSENDDDDDDSENDDDDNSENDDDDDDSENDDDDDDDDDDNDKPSENMTQVPKGNLFLIKPTDVTQLQDPETVKPKNSKPEKSLQDSRTEAHNNDATYMTQREKIENKAVLESKRIEYLNGRFDFSKPGTNPKDRGSRPETSRIHKVYPKGITNPRGLMNTGVTCYMNSALQALFHIPAMAWYLKDVYNDTYRGKLPAKSVTRDVAVLHQRLTDPSIRKEHFTPRQLIKRLDDINPLMSEWEQEDSHEYFMSLLGRLQEDSVPKGMKLNSSIIHEMFGGTFLQTVVCKECKHESKTHQDFFDIQVSIDKTELKYTDKATLTGSLRHYFEPSVIHKTKTEGYDCEKCKKKTNATTNVKIEHAPEYLVVSVKRYEYTNNAVRGSSQKIKHHLQIAPQLELSQFAEDSQEPMRYQLLSFVSHEGRSASSGHYIAHCLQNNDNWAMYDDEFVQSLGNTSKMLKSKLDVYFMVYTRLQSIPKTRLDQSKKAESRNLKKSESHRVGHDDHSSQDRELDQSESLESLESLESRNLHSSTVEKPHKKKHHKKNSKSAGPISSLSFQPKNTLKHKKSQDLHSSSSFSVSKPSSSFDKLAKKMRKSQASNSQHNSVDFSSQKNARSGPALQKYGSQKKRKVSEIDAIFNRNR